MSIPVYQLNGLGNFEPAGLEVDSLTELARVEPDGVYTVSRTYRGHQAVMLEAHLSRLEESARLERIPIQLDRQALRAALRRLLREAGFPEARFRITIPSAQPAAPLLAAEPLPETSAALRQQGVAAATLRITRLNPRAKSNAWIAARERAQQQLPSGAYEGIILSPQDELLEGFSSNIYAVLEGQLRTSEDSMLYGIARRIVLEVAGSLLPVRLEPARLADLPRLQEALLSSSGRGVVPIVRVDGQPVGSGTPGPITRALQSGYDAWVERHLEPI
jgi:branched-subunit amino acid aminotransferase/4-amino-4-deoxychorismate lyase